MENRALYGPSIDVQLSSQKPPIALLASILTNRQEFQIQIRAGAAFALRLSVAAPPKMRPLIDLRHSTSFVTGGTKVN